MSTFNTKFVDNRFNGSQEVVVSFNKYVNGGVAILLSCADGQPYAKASINVSEGDRLEHGIEEVAIKGYSEGEGMEKLLIDNGIILAKVLKEIEVGRSVVNLYQLSQASLDLIGGNFKKKFNF